MFTKQGGIASSQKALMTFRFSTEHISSNGKYNIGKARAVRQFLRWAKKKQSCKPFIEEKEKWERDNAIEFFIQTNGWRKYLTLFFIPWTWSNLRTVWIVTIKKILHR